MLAFAFQQELTLWRLLELKMELLIQCVPAFLLALHWPRQRAGATFAGLVAGTILAVGLTFSGHARLWGIHAGVIGLGVNAAVVIAGSILMSGPSTADRRTA